ncbi:hypothetical protein Cgig2_016783 [Carnegiea gigantea]|uniref:Uncharacterized protein n=1 Tax=Carnegiea gigantea TaxID=171969 RepID=A0A9Q1JFZ6_9CARY|nr:hypothetical protein Cgig2_016783 [Carnegiea gigantea]
MINGVKCAKIIKEDVNPDVEYWQNAVLCSVLGANLTMKATEGYFNLIWKAHGIDKIILEWRAIQRNPLLEGTANDHPKEGSAPVEEPQYAGLILVSRRDTARATAASDQPNRRTEKQNNTYQVLVDTEGQSNRGEERRGIGSNIAARMNNAWCILGDSNSVLYKEDRLGGDAITDHEIKEFAACIETCELTEMRSTGAYYSWTNKTVWSRIDRVKGRNPKIDLHIEAIKSLPIWVQLSDLDIKYWGAESLSKIGGIMGIPLKSDKYTMEKTMLDYARLLIEMPMDGTFPKFIEFINDKDVLVQQQRGKQNVTATESNMEKQAAQPAQLEEMQMDGFIPVRKRDATRVVTQPHISTSPARNSYEALSLLEQ